VDAHGAIGGVAVTTVDIVIDSIAAGGDGVGRANGVVVFVPRSARGDRARVELDTHKRFARGTIRELLEGSPDRVDPLCYHYRVDRCGGCQLQHVAYDAQLEAKRIIIRDSLARIGRRQVDAPDIDRAEEQWRYRRKLTLGMRRGGSGDWAIGLHPLDDPVNVFQLADCPITDERVIGVWRQVMDARRHFPVADKLRASVRLVDEGAAVVMEGGNAWPERLSFFEAVQGATALWWKPAHRARSLVASRGAPAAGASFAQVNAAMGARLHDFVFDRAHEYDAETVLDAYAGSGATAIRLARSGARVTAVEADRDASARCAAELPEGSRAIAARVEDVISQVLPVELVLVNPPRTGLHERVTAELQGAEQPPRAIIYVSCDPPTLARDLARLPRYRIASLKAFDMFPQTAHVETVCELVPEVA
jgi:23S rRNA (uracil1939-C5)-methyltransferase